MFKKLMTLVLIVALVFSSVAYAFAGESDYAYELSLSRLNAVYDYLNEFYVGSDEIGYEIEYVSNQDVETLQALADYITSGCETDKEKCDAIWTWMDANVKISFSSYSPIDVFRTLSGVCSGHAQLMSALFRLSGIQSVICRGYLLNTKSTLLSAIYDGVDEGHQWVMAYVDGDWYVYDDLWNEKGNNDKDAIATKYYTVNVDGVSVYAEGMDLTKDEFNYTQTLYRDGEFVGIRNDKITNESSASFSYGGCLRYCKSYFHKVFNSYYTYENGALDMPYGYAIPGGYYFMYGKSVFYVKPTGILLNKTVIEYDDELYLPNSGCSVKIDEDIDNNGLSNGCVNMYVGETIELPECYEDATLISLNKSIASTNGRTITALKEGYANVRVCQGNVKVSFEINVYGDVINSKDTFKEFCDHDCTHCVLDEEYCDYCGLLIETEEEVEEVVEEVVSESAIELEEEVVEEIIIEEEVIEPAIETEEETVEEVEVIEEVEETVEPIEEVEETVIETEEEIIEISEEVVEEVTEPIEEVEEVTEEIVEEETVEEVVEEVIEETPTLLEEIIETVEEEVVNFVEDFLTPFTSPIIEEVEEEVVDVEPNEIFDEEIVAPEVTSTPIPTSSNYSAPILANSTKKEYNKEVETYTIENCDFVNVVGNVSYTNNTNSQYTVYMNINCIGDINVEEVLKDEEVLAFLIKCVNEMYKDSDSKEFTLDITMTKID